MRFRLRTLFFAIALVGAFLGGRVSVLPVVEEHQQENKWLAKQLKSLEKLRPVLSSIQQDEKLRRSRLEDEITRLNDEILVLQVEKKSRLNGRLAFPVNIERAMLGDGSSASP